MNRTSAEQNVPEDATASWGFVECAIPGGLLALVITWELTRPQTGRDSLAPRIATCVVFLLVVVYLLDRVRRRAARELMQVRAVARAAQEALLRPLPSRLEGLALYARQLSASRGAEVGGDLYEVMATPHGVRVIIGDVRGHGLPAIGAVAAVLGSFREAAHDESGLDGVLRRLDRAHERRLRELLRREPDCAAAVRLGGTAGTGGAGGTGMTSGAAETGETARTGEPARTGGAGRTARTGRTAKALGAAAARRAAETAAASDIAEEFVTVLLLEIGSDAEVRALNCGHPWPYRLGPGVEPLAWDEPLPPLGALPLPAELTPYRCGQLLPGEALFLYTDGAEDARDAAGRFFGLREVLLRAVSSGPLPPATLVRQVHAELLRHTGGRVTDDMALLVLRNDRVPGDGRAVTQDRTSLDDRSPPDSHSPPDDRTRVPTQSGEPVLRRTRRAPSHP